jgi:DNA polymerase-3 subunit alpha
LGYTRMGLMQTFEQILGQTTDRRKKESKGQFDLFGTLDENPFELTIEIPNEEWPKEKKLEIEREALGLYVSDHPLRGVENMLANRTNCTLADIQDRQHGDRITIGGLLMSVEKKFTKKNDLMAILQLEDLFSTVEVVVFPKTLPKVEALLKEGKIVTATGRIDVQGERTKFLLDEMQEIRLIIDDGVPLHLDLNKDELDTVEELKNAFDQYPGKSTVFIHYGDKVFRLPEEFNVEVCPQLTKNINAILGRG